MNLPLDASIIYIDDDPACHFFLKSHLPSLSTHISFHSFEDFQPLEPLLDRIGKMPRPLVLMDIYFPGKKSFLLLKSIREVYSPTEVPVLLLTDSARDTDRRQGEALGAQVYLEKPWTLDQWGLLGKTIVETVSQPVWNFEALTSISQMRVHENQKTDPSIR